MLERYSGVVGRSNDGSGPQQSRGVTRTRLANTEEVHIQLFHRCSKTATTIRVSSVGPLMELQGSGRGIIGLDPSSHLSDENFKCQGGSSDGASRGMLVCEVRSGGNDDGVGSPSKEAEPMYLAFGGNTRDLGSFGEETDKTTDLHQHFSRLCSQRLETASKDERDAVTIHPMTVSQESMTASARVTQPKI
ncbi:hypothetical protein Tco_1360900 [Tanacetum coccineum]